MAAAPPVPVTTATRRPRGGRWPVTSRGVSNRLSSMSTRMMPLSRKKASGDLVRPGHRPGVRDRHLPSDAGAPELVGDHRLARGEGPSRRPREPVGVAKHLEEQQDRAGIGVVHQHLRQLADAEIALVADRHQLREAELARPRAGHDAAQQAAALRDDAERAGRGLLVLEDGVDGERGRALHVDDPHAVRPEQAQAPAARAPHHLALPGEPLLAQLREPGAEDGRDRHAALAALVDHRGHRRRRHHDERVVDRRRAPPAGRDRPVRPAPRCGPGLIGRIAPAIAVLAQETLRARVVLRGVRRGADQRHRARRRTAPAPRQGTGGSSSASERRES